MIQYTYLKKPYQMLPNHRKLIKITLLSVACCVAIVNVAHFVEQQTSRWEHLMQAFEQQDKANFPPKQAILFAGSSSIVFWRSLAEDMAPLTVINRGFGGSQMSELNYYRDRIVIPYEPRAVVVYEGDNDVAAGKLPDEILMQYQHFIENLKEELPKTDIFLIAVKPSIQRKSLWHIMQDVNTGLQQLADQHEHVQYLDIATPMLDEDGEINPNLFVEDNLHMNKKGYAIWAEVIRPVLMEKYGVDEQS